ncbi:hypothetical protein CLOP_g9923 [Closterium sp. NIES-67]|nr:hypothetical protein CLOP_g9923 [Closterium sp. NIES-67]
MSSATAKSAPKSATATSVPAAAKAANVVPETPAVVPVRLVAPGQLYHILRKAPASLQEQFNLPPLPAKREKHAEEKLFVEEETDMDKRGMFDAQKQQNGVAVGGEVKEEAPAPAPAPAVVAGPAVSHVVVRGADPKPRFLRIILSDALLADHSCKLYGKGIIDAMQWCM